MIHAATTTMTVAWFQRVICAIRVCLLLYQKYSDKQLEKRYNRAVYMLLDYQFGYHDGSDYYYDFVEWQREYDFIHNENGWFLPMSRLSVAMVILGKYSQPFMVDADQIFLVHGCSTMNLFECCH